MLFLIILNHTYGEKIPVQMDAKVTDYLVVTMTKKELQQAKQTWKQVHLSTVISKRNTVKGLNIPVKGQRVKSTL